MSCPVCNEAGCDYCGTVGTIEITECPQRLAGNDCVDLANLTDIYEKGLPPVSGGVLDQSNWFVTAAARLMNDERELGKMETE